MERPIDVLCEEERLRRLSERVTFDGGRVNSGANSDGPNWLHHMSLHRFHPPLLSSQEVYNYIAATSCYIDVPSSCYSC